MIKFNQVVRASVLSLTLACGLGLSQQAFAYDQADLDDASSEYYSRLYVWQGDLAELSALQSGLDSTIYYCIYLQNFQDPGFCINDAHAYYDPLILAEQNDVATDEALTNSAQSWMDYVQNHQNNIHGQP